MKILHTADWHLGTFRSPMKDGVNLRTKDTIRCLDELIKTAQEEQPDYSLVSGDVFHVGRLWSDRCCEEIITAITYIKKLAAVSKQVIVMRGTPNHDGAGQFNVLAEMFSDVPNVHIVTTPQVITFDDVDVAVLPGFDRGVFRAKFPGMAAEEENEVFTKELANIVAGLKAQCMPGKKTIFMAHYTVPGCNTESGQTMMLTQFEPIIPQEALLAADYDLVALGHIHRPQKILGNNWYYSGAINAMNFNDEGQERGFWIHTYANGGWESNFHNTPIREFATINLSDKDISYFNASNIATVATMKWRGRIDGKIVRVHYSCSTEDNKALNKAALEKELLDDGAFMVWEILPDKINETVNRTELENTTDPEANLIKYLEEKQMPPETLQELVLKARSIISEAEANSPTAANTGTFEPIEISVKNYRNYVDETFNFESITFCTINGQNGAGKSSLFMDAIIDCLYEEPREGFIKDEQGKAAWLRNDDKARSGSIMFTFRIGKKTYRVTRTRARSGKGTLNIAERVDGEWKDRSRERINDTQKEILNILGMDSFTFKSCALIMQDQYGIFLQAKPEERVEVLSTLLGLGVYQTMEKIATEKAKENGAKNRELIRDVDTRSAEISSYGSPAEELAECNKLLAEREKLRQEKVMERDNKKLLLVNQQAAAERRAKALTEIVNLRRKKTEAEVKISTQQAIVDNCRDVLADKDLIKAKVAERDALLKRELELAGQSALYSTKKRETENYQRQISSEQKQLDEYKAKALQKSAELERLQPTEQDAVIKANAEKYAKKKAALDIEQSKVIAYQQAKAELTAATHHVEEITNRYDAERKMTGDRKKTLEKKVAILQETGCIDIENARCRFLKDAIEAKEQLLHFEKIYADIEQRREKELAETKRIVDEKSKKLQSLDFDASNLTNLQNECATLFPYVAKAEEIDRKCARIALVETELKHLQSNICEAEKRLAEVKMKAIQAEMECNTYSKAFEEHVQVLSSITALDSWIVKEKQLPVAEEKYTTATNRIGELLTEIDEISVDITEKQAEADKELSTMTGMAELEAAVNTLNTEVTQWDNLIRANQIQIGALNTKVEHIARLKKEIAYLKEQQIEYAKEMAHYDTLKAAFGQSGIPHQIIRSIIPQLTATANTILGQMTGGKMGVDFRLEKVLKNGKEKGSLDIFIEEYGKATLPYLSKSGGEKVKSSLSVILALAELKLSSAGIQLGMLFIDEPPFLDGDGIQAYCDALETIQRRYPDIKIMAITHDPTMKARFPQNLDVVKTEQGSKVIY